MHFITILTGTALVQVAIAGYGNGLDYFEKGAFFDNFKIETMADPTNGYVNYVNNPSLYSMKDGKAYIGVDNTNTVADSSRGRDSIRISSHQTYDIGNLVVLDLAHMPSNACGSWPAFWMNSNSNTWPKGGEIDILEGVNDGTQNFMTLHTLDGCSMPNRTGSGSEKAALDTCISGGGQNAGCGLKVTGQGAYANSQGGIYATEITTDGIKIWFNPTSTGGSNSGPLGSSPDPTTWGNPTGYFPSTQCDIKSYFYQLNLIFDITFCGDWAGKVWDGSSCAASTKTDCKSYVKNNPSAFADTYFLVNGLKIYKVGGASSAPASTAAPSSNSSATSVAMSSPPESSPPEASTTLASIPASVAAPVVTVTAPAVTETALRADDFGRGSHPRQTRSANSRIKRHLAGHKNGHNS